ncbi:hypothetical protein ABBQ38_003310 [Trebouxia sp. C0009 RCD-2024]
MRNIHWLFYRPGQSSPSTHMQSSRAVRSTHARGNEAQDLRKTTVVAVTIVDMTRLLFQQKYVQWVPSMLLSSLRLLYNTRFNTGNIFGHHLEARRHVNKAHAADDVWDFPRSHAP